MGSIKSNLPVDNRRENNTSITKFVVSMIPRPSFSKKRKFSKRITHVSQCTFEDIDENGVAGGRLYDDFQAQDLTVKLVSWLTFVIHSLHWEYSSVTYSQWGLPG